MHSNRGDFVLLKGEVVNDIPELIDKEKAWIDAWFSKIERWTPKVKMKERLTWVVFYGVPLHLWNDNCLTQLFNVVGSLIKLDPTTVSRKRLDFACGLISTLSLTRIDKVIKVKAGNMEYDVSFMEVTGGGEPWNEKEVSLKEEVFSDTDDDDRESDNSNHRWNGGDDGNDSKKSWEDVVVGEWVPESLHIEPGTAPFSNIVNRLMVIQQTNLLSMAERKNTACSGATSMEKADPNIRSKGVVAEVASNKKDKQTLMADNSGLGIGCVASSNEPRQEREGSSSNPCTHTSAWKSSGSLEGVGPTNNVHEDGVESSTDYGKAGPKIHTSFLSYSSNKIIGPFKKFTKGQKLGKGVILEKKIGWGCKNLAQMKKRMTRGKQGRVLKEADSISNNSSLPSLSHTRHHPNTL
ncbi:hypothetical protein RIF29_17164 [Crotalaria pallida]|uniref:DUF4283 domain-containing protein n=1 Tax=Crotalaria pallida TaxID=3830 RepID=A0AAN9FQ15_CROPI